MDGLSVPSHGMKLLVGSGNPALSKEIAEHLGVDPAKTTITRFADGEIFVRIDENIRGNDVFIVQPTNPPAENIMELLLLIDAARRASAARITCVMPYYGYSRQDRKDQPRVAIGAKLMANMIVAAGADRVLGIDFHQHQLQGFFDVPVDHLYAAPVFVSHYKKKHLNDLVVVAPDVGSAKMARGFAKRLNGSLAIIDKRRPKANVSEVVNVVGEVEGQGLPARRRHDRHSGHGRRGGAGAEGARREGCIRLRDACAALRPRRRAAPQRADQGSDGDGHVRIPEEKRFPQLHVLSVGELLAKAIRYTHSEQSVSSLFEQ